jgi:type IV pilus assembly protein PilA
MRPELQSKFIQQLNRKNIDAGFTLIELLVTIVIIGIFSAIAIPNLLSQDVKAKQTEAKQNVALINKTQNSYRSEKSSFASSFDDLAIGTVSGGVTSSTTNYTYAITGAVETANVIASPRDSSLKGFSGGISRFSNTANMSVTATVLCQNLAAGSLAVAPTNPGGTAPTCTGATTTLSL